MLNCSSELCRICGGLSSAYLWHLLQRVMLRTSQFSIKTSWNLPRANNFCKLPPTLMLGSSCILSCLFIHCSCSSHLGEINWHYCWGNLLRHIHRKKPRNLSFLALASFGGTEMRHIVVTDDRLGRILVKDDSQLSQCGHRSKVLVRFKQSCIFNIVKRLQAYSYQQ